MNEPKKMALIASKGTLDWAYPPFILASTAAAMEMEVAVFFTFYGLTLLKKDIKAKVAPASNPAMPMKMPFGPKGFQDFEWPMPNILMGNVPGFETMATSLMKQTFKKKGVATIEELRDICLESDVNLIGCQMTMDVFGFEKELWPFSTCKIIMNRDHLWIWWNRLFVTKAGNSNAFMMMKWRRSTTANGVIIPFISRGPMRLARFILHVHLTFVYRRKNGILFTNCWLW